VQRPGATSSVRTEEILEKAILASGLSAAGAKLPSYRPSRLRGLRAILVNAKNAPVTAMFPGVAQGAQVRVRKGMFPIASEQLAPVQAAAMKRAQEGGTMRPDASEYVREAHTAWLKGVLT